MSDADRDPAGEQSNIPIRSRRPARDFPSPLDDRKPHLLGRLAEEAAGLRANARALGDRIEHLSRLVAQRRVG